MPQKDVIALSLTSEENYAFFESMRHTNQFLMHVVHGEYDAVVALLKKNSHLLLHKGRVTDYSGRTFFYISGFQYALWALDKHMWIRMLDCLPLNETGAKIKDELYKQYLELKEKGVSYELNGERRRENHFDFENTIITALQTQVDFFDGTYDQINNWDEIDQQWREGVGSAQKQLPMHVVYWYCGDVPFHPVPDFIEQPSLKKQFYNWISNKYENWFHLDSKLGVDFAIYKGYFTLATTPQLGTYSAPIVHSLEDLLAMQTLGDVRSADFIELESLLLEPLVFDNQSYTPQSYSV